jgi:hypothetical protein
LQRSFLLINHHVSPRFGSRPLVFTVSSIHRPECCRGVCLTRTVVVELSDAVVFGRTLPDTLAELKALVNIIQSSVEQIEAVVSANSFSYPSPDSTFGLESEAPRMHPAIQSAGSLITSAASQLITLVRPAPVTLIDTMMQVKLNICYYHVFLLTTVRILKFHVSTAMRNAISMHVAEILRDAGPKVTFFHNRFAPAPDPCCVGKACVRNCQADQGSPQKIGCVSWNIIYCS